VTAALAFAGDAVRPRTVADDLANRFPDHTILQSYDLPTIRAKLTLSHDDPSNAEAGQGGVCEAPMITGFLNEQ
jgi:hypothetical protein